MNLLAIDTSTEIASVALQVKGELRTVEQGAQRQHAQLLLPMVEQLLAESELSLAQLDGIVFGRGPGSFTGLRIACSVAKGLAYANDLPLYPVSSLAVIAHQAFLQDEVLTKDQRVLAVLDARMNQLYWACYNYGAFDSEEQVSDPDKIVVDLDKSLILAGVAYEPYLSQLSAGLQANLIKQLSIYPKAGAMINLACSGNIATVSAADAKPVYVRNQITQGEARG